MSNNGDYKWCNDDENNDRSCNKKTHCCIPGPVGPQGPKGDTGVPGQQGIQGQTGQNGQQGIQGQDGQNGQNGQQGIGLQGQMGPRGDMGPMGPQGPAGCCCYKCEEKPGPPGPAGPAGPCCDPCCTEPMQKLLNDVAVEQNKIIGDGRGVNDAVIGFATEAVEDSQLNNVIIPLPQPYASLISVIDEVLNPKISNKNIIPICDVTGISSDLTTNIGKFLSSYILPSIDKTQCCKTTTDFMNLFESLILIPNIQFNLTLTENGFKGLMNLTLIAVGKGLITVETKDKVYIISICSIKNVYFKQLP